MRGEVGFERVGAAEEERKTKSGPGETGPNTPLSKPSPGDPRSDELAVREEGAEILSWSGRK